MDQQRFADATAAVGGLYKKVLEINSGPADECGEIVKEESEAHRLRVQVRQNNFGDGARPEQSFAQQVFGGDNLMGQFFIFGKFANEAEDQRDITLSGGNDFDHAVRIASGLTC